MIQDFVHIMPVDSDSQHERRQFMLRAAAIAVNAAVQATIIYSSSHYDRIPYHTSALTGAAWVRELINGHPERICCELGVHLHVFQIIVEYLKVIGHTHSREVFLEEQLAIFLYRCTTGLSIRHVGERFQRSNETISRCVIYIVALARSGSILISCQIFYKDAQHILVSPLLH